jgi:hypothetical protein
LRFLNLFFVSIVLSLFGFFVHMFYFVHYLSIYDIFVKYSSAQSASRGIGQFAVAVGKGTLPVARVDCAPMAGAFVESGVVEVVASRQQHKIAQRRRSVRKIAVLI